jgi:hypothetical protein
MKSRKICAHLLQKIDDARLQHAQFFVGGVGCSQNLEDPGIESSLIRLDGICTITTGRLVMPRRWS